MKTGYSFGSLVSFVEALNAAAVKITGDQTIAGLKTFSSNPITSAAQGSGGGYLTRKDYVDDALALKAPLASPALTGVPTAPTAAAGTNTAQLATTAFVTSANTAQLADVAPLMDGTAGIGDSTKLARQDHRHPTDTSRAPLASPALSGTPTAPTAAADTNTTQIATTAFVQSAINSAESAVSLAESYEGNRWFFIGKLPVFSSVTRDTYEAFGEFGSWGGERFPFTMTATNRGGLKVRCVCDTQVPFYFYTNPDGGVDIFVYLEPYQIIQGQTWCKPQGVAYRFGQNPDITPTGSQVYTTYGKSLRPAYLTSPNFDGAVGMSGNLNVDGTTTTNGFNAGSIVSQTTIAAGTNIIAGDTISAPRLVSTAVDQGGLRFTGGPFGVMCYNSSDDNFYFLLTNINDQFGGYNSLRPFTINKRTGLVLHQHGLSVVAGLWTDQVHISSTTNSAPTQAAGTNNTTIATTAFVQAMKIEVAKMLYPVGSYYANDTDSTNPATLFGFGTWVRVEGRALMGCDGTGAGTFGTPGSQGGALTHGHTATGTAITVAQMPAHGHTIGMNVSGSGSEDRIDGYIHCDDSSGASPLNVPIATHIAANNNGGGQTHTHTIQSAPSLPPYRVVYLWRRTA